MNGVASIVLPADLPAHLLSSTLSRGQGTESPVFEPSLGVLRPGPSGPESLQLETTGTTSQVEHLPGLSKITILRHSVAAKLREEGYTVRADELDECHSRWMVAECNGCRKTRKFPNRCDRFYCPECQPRLAKDRKESVEWWVDRIEQPKHMVLTVRNVPILTKSFVKQFKGWFARLRRRAFARNWRGGLYSLEVTNEGNGWHLHLHALVDARWIDASALSIEWNDVTDGFGYIVKVLDARATHDKPPIVGEGEVQVNCRGSAKSSYLKEVAKYAVKGTELARWNGCQVMEFILAMEGVKCFGVFGSLYGKRTEWKAWIDSLKEHGLTCDCGCSDWNLYSMAEWDWELLKRAENANHAPRPPATAVNLDFNFRDEPMRLVMPH